MQIAVRSGGFLLDSVTCAVRVGTRRTLLRLRRFGLAPDQIKEKGPARAPIMRIQTPPSRFLLDLVSAAPRLLGVGTNGSEQGERGSAAEDRAAGTEIAGP